jgi:uncharacterized membrane protein
MRLFYFNHKVHEVFSQKAQRQLRVLSVVFFFVNSVVNKFKMKEEVLQNIFYSLYTGNLCCR